MSIQIPEDELTLAELYRGHKAITMEGFAESFASINVVNALRSNYQRMSSFVGNLFKAKNVAYPKLGKQYIDILKDFSYADIYQLRAYVPAGMSVKMNQYATLLQGAADKSMSTIMGDLTTLTAVCGRAINDDEYRRGTGFAKDIPATHVDAELDLIKKAFKRGAITQVTIGKAYNNDADIQDTYVTLEKTLDVANGLNPKDVRAAVDRFMVVCDGLTTKLKEDYQANGISNAVIADISEAIFLVAKEAEFYAFLVNAIAETVTAWNDTWAKAAQSVK